VYVRDNRVWVATDDSTSIVNGDLLTLSSRGKTVAEGRVTAAVSGLAVATLTSGSLEKEKKLERLSVARERPKIAVPATIRIGYPAWTRKNLIVACGKWTPASFVSMGYSSETLGPRSYRLVRAPGSTEPSLPETLSVRLFQDALDEEIAIERGELDAAVFWPGELSSHMRESPRWSGGPQGVRGDLLVVSLSDSDSTTISLRDQTALVDMNRTLFRGDLVPRKGSARDGMLSGAFDVSPDIPGHGVINGLLNRGRESLEPRFELRYVDLPDSSDTSPGPPGTVVRYTVRCTIVCRPEIRAFVSQAPDALVRFECSP